MQRHDDEKGNQCSERVFEVNIELHGGISGAPILNVMGEVVGLVTYSETRSTMSSGVRVRMEQSFYAIPINVLRRMRTSAS